MASVKVMQGRELKPSDIEWIRGLVQGLLAHEHYLGARNSLGENIRYLVRNRFGRPAACALFGSGAWKCVDRDAFIGCGVVRKSFLILLAGDRRRSVGEAVGGNGRGLRGDRRFGGAGEAFAVVGEINRRPAGGSQDDHVADGRLLDSEAVEIFWEPLRCVGDFAGDAWDCGKGERICGEPFMECGAGFHGEERLPAGDALSIGPLAADGVEDAVFGRGAAPEGAAEDEFGWEGLFEGFAGGGFGWPGGFLRAVEKPCGAGEEEEDGEEGCGAFHFKSGGAGGPALPVRMRSRGWR